MPLLISDAAVVRDLERGGLIVALSSLPDEIVVPNLLTEHEIAPPTMLLMQAAGVRTIALDPGELEEAIKLHRQCGSLSLTECCAIVVAKIRQAVMLASYGLLREEALRQGNSVCCALWCLDQIERSGSIDVVRLYACLQAMIARPRCNYPQDQIAIRVSRFARARSNASTLSQGAA